jgi:site-specific DNA-methyltransferase (adenine-specific)
MFAATDIKPLPTLDTCVDRIINGDCINVLAGLPPECIDLVVTDPPYLVNYRSRDGRSILNDRDDSWLKPAFAEIYRVMKPDSFCISFYGWNQVEKFMLAWKQVGLFPVGHIVFKKLYPSSRRFLRRYHESAYLLAKGYPVLPGSELPDVLHWQYSGNELHPNQKPVMAIRPLISSFSRQGDIVLDPFCGSGTTAVAAKETGRRFIGIEKDESYFKIAENRLSNQSSACRTPLTCHRSPNR